MESKSFEQRIDAFTKKADAGIRNWVQNDQFFNGMRNTPARILLAAITVGVLYGLPLLQLLVGGVSIWLYAALLAVCVVSQKLSVRFAFDDDAKVDEYQNQRRNLAYRRAYQRVGLIIGLGVALVAGNGAYLKATLGTPFVYSFDLASLNWSFVFVFLFGLFVLQKYLSWGIKGEPWVESAQK